MKVVTEYPNGVFSWVDLSTTDSEGAKAFYGGLFGWEFDDQPTDMGTVYTMCKIDGHSVAGMGPQPPEMTEQGILHSGHLMSNMMTLTRLRPRSMRQAVI